MHDVAILIGRFQPFHLGHLRIVETALKQAKRLLILVGSSNLGRTTRNPFLASERARMIDNVLAEHGFSDRVVITGLPDSPYDLQGWLKRVQETVWGMVSEKSDIAIIGHQRDQSSFYLRRFPHWHFIDVAAAHLNLNATDIRNAMFNDILSSVEEKLPQATIEWLRDFRTTTFYRDLKEEFVFERNYRERWGAGPHQTVDPVVVQSGHVLCVRRGDSPGRGLLALPGGHLERGESCGDAVLRELFEETNIFRSYPHAERTAKLWPHFRARERFDDPLRSCRAHVITEAFLFKLPDTQELPVVEGGDDAAEAMWIPLADLHPRLMFEDHAFIIDKMLRYLG